MRQLFLPACVCLMTWSSATGMADSKLSLDEFAGTMAQKKDLHAPIAMSSFDKPPFDKPPIDKSPTDKPNVAETAARQAAGATSDILLAVGDLAIEPPVPSGVVVNNGIPTGVPLPPIAKPVIARTTEEICDTLAYAAQDNDLPAAFFIRLLFQESRFKPGVVSSAGAQGVAQFMPETAADMGLENPFDPIQAIPASARLLRNLIRQFGNLGLAAAAYNAGPKRIADWLADRRKNKLPEETQGYVKTITGHPAERWTEATARHPGEKLPRHAPCQKAAGLLAWNGPDAIPLPVSAPPRAAVKKDNKDKTKAAEIKLAANEKTETGKTKTENAVIKQADKDDKNQKPAKPEPQKKREAKAASKHTAKTETKTETKPALKKSASSQQSSDKTKSADKTKPAKKHKQERLAQR